jgi:integrase
MPRSFIRRVVGVFAVRSRTAASLAIHAGANPKVVQRMLGHASAAMTLDVYADLFDSDLESVADNVAKLWPNVVRM